MTIKIRQRPKEDYRSKTSGERQKRAESKSKETFYHRNLSIPKDSRFTSKQSQREREKMREREREREGGWRRGKNSRRAESWWGRAEGTQGVGYPYCWRKLSLFSSLHPSLAMLCKKRHGRYHVVIGSFSLNLFVHWVSLPCTTLFLFLCFTSTSPRFCLSPSPSFPPSLILFFPFHSPRILSLSLLLSNSLSSVPRSDDISSIPSSNPRHFWARQESLCNWHHSARVTGTKCFWYGPVGRKTTETLKNRVAKSNGATRGDPR